MSSIQKQLIDGQIRTIIKKHQDWFQSNDNPRPEDLTKAFTLFTVYMLLSIDIEEAYRAYTDGGQDYGIDSIVIEDQTNDYFNIYIFQTKYSSNLEVTKGYSLNDVEQLIKTIREYIVHTPDSVNFNPVLSDSIMDIKNRMDSGQIPYFKCLFANNGEWNPEAEKRLEENKKTMRDQFDYEYVNYQKLADLLLSMASKTIEKERLKLEGNFMVDDIFVHKVLVGKVSVQTIYDLVEKHNSKLFEKNIRRFLGIAKNRVNESIQKTLLHETEKYNFYYYNNGITIICDKIIYDATPHKLSDRTITVKEMQIINGAQTCNTIYQTLKDSDGKDFEGVYVMVRIYEISSDNPGEIVNSITYATNSQTPVDLRDLKANHDYLKILTEDLKRYGYDFRSKKESEHTSTDMSIPSSTAAEAVLAVWRKKPAIAKFRRKELFGKYYDDIFTNLNGAQLIIAVLIFRFSDSQRKKEDLVQDRPHLPYSSYWVACYMGQVLLEQVRINLEKLNHLEFEKVKKYWDDNRVTIYQQAVSRVDELLAKEFDLSKTTDYRKISAFFRRADLMDTTI